MIDLAADVAAIFGGPEFSVRLTRRRAGAPDLEIRMVIGVVDDEVLEGRALAAVRKGAFPTTTDVRADDLLIAVDDVDASMPAGSVLQALDNPRRICDGLESEVLLGKGYL